MQANLTKTKEYIMKVKLQKRQHRLCWSIYECCLSTRTTTTTNCGKYIYIFITPFTHPIIFLLPHVHHNFDQTFRILQYQMSFHSFSTPKKLKLE